MFITKSVNLFGAKLKHLHEQFGSVFFIISNTKMKWIPHVFCIYLLSSQIFYIFLWKPVIFNFNLVFWVIHEEFVYVFINWILWWNFCHSVHNSIHESISWTFCKSNFILHPLAKFLPHWSQLNLFIFMISCDLLFQSRVLCLYLSFQI